MSIFDQREAPGPGNPGALTQSATTPTNRPKSSGQAGRVLAMLGDSEAVCATTFLQAYIPRAAAVIYRLRRQGYVISTRRCSRFYHDHQSHQIEYVLEALPRDPGSGDV